MRKAAWWRGNPRAGRTFVRHRAVKRIPELHSEEERAGHLLAPTTVSPAQPHQARQPFGEHRLVVGMALDRDHRRPELDHVGS